MKPIIILLGPPGCGKGTQAQILKQELNIPHISTGDILRAEVSKQSEIGIKAKEYMHNGQLVPEEIMIEMVITKLKSRDCAGGYILDGFPRTVNQALALDKILEHSPTVIYFSIPDSMLVKRITGRLSCEKCGSVFHREFSPPQIDNQCDRCGEQLTQRKDDTEEIVVSRLAAYHSQTAPVVKHYSKQGYLIEIDATRDKKQISEEISSLVSLEKKI